MGKTNGGIDIKVIVVDCDYLANRKGEPVLRLYCKNVSNSEDIILHVKNFEPYFYVHANDIHEVETKLIEYVKKVEIVEKFLPIGYQIEKTQLIKVTLFNPKNTPECRRICEEELRCIVYEADILFKNRFLIDMGIVGMGILEFNEIGKELKPYGTNVEQLYIIDKNEIQVTDEKITIEY